MRKFYLENAFGERRDLNGGAAWLINPQGLGVSSAGNYAETGRGFYVSTNAETIPRDGVVGELVFVRAEEAYAKYRDLINWIMAASRLYLIYVPFGKVEFYREIEVEYIQKGELGAGKLLTAPCSFLPLTPWFKKVPTIAQISFTEEDVNGKRYTHTYDYAYIKSVAAATAEIRATGHIPAAVSLAYTGALKTPRLTLTGKTSGTVYADIAIDASAEDGETFEYSSRYNDSYIRMRTATGIIDLINAVDVTSEVFLKIPTAEVCLLSLLAENTLTGNTVVSIYDYYRSV